MAKTATKAAKKKSIYGVHPGVMMAQRWIAELKQKTDRTLEEWLRLIKKEGPPTEKERRDWLKTKYGLGTNSAWWLAERSFGKGEEIGDPDQYLRAAEKYVEAMFAGKKEPLKACPCQTIVPLYRKHVFAQIKPTTQTRIDFGLALGDTKKTPKRLIDTGGYAKMDRITHRFEITSLKDIDDEVKGWLKVAYDRDA